MYLESKPSDSSREINFLTVCIMNVEEYDVKTIMLSYAIVLNDILYTQKTFHYI